MERLPQYPSKKDYEILNISDSLHKTPETVQIQAFLTKKQRELIQYAVDNGFFEIPRGIKSKKIANKFNILVSAFNELLRRVKRKIFNILFKKQNY